MNATLQKLTEHSPGQPSLVCGILDERTESHIAAARRRLGEAFDTLEDSAFREPVERALCGADDALQAAWSELNKAELLLAKASLMLREPAERFGGAVDNDFTGEEWQHGAD